MRALCLDNVSNESAGKTSESEEWVKAGGKRKVSLVIRWNK